MTLIVIPHLLRISKSKHKDRILNRRSKEENKNTKDCQNYKESIR